MNRWPWIAMSAGVALALAVSYRIAHLALLLGSEQGRWVYRYIYGFNSRSLVIGAIAFVVLGVPLMLPAAIVRRREWWLIAFCLCAGTVTQIRLRVLAPYTIGRMFESDGSNGYYGATRQYPASVLLRDFDRLRPTLTIHPRSNLPGKLALVYALERISLDPNVLAVLIIVLSNLGGLFLYVFVRDLTGDVSTAMASLVFYLAVPSKLFFFPILNTVTPLGVFVCLALWGRVLKTHAVPYAIALGAALFGMTVFEPLPLVTGVVFAGLGANAIARSEIRWNDMARQAAIAAAAFVVSALAAWAWLRFDLVGVFRHVMNDAVEFNTIADRPYRIWVWRNLIDFGIGAGLCQVFLLIAAVAVAIRRTGSWRDAWRDPLTAFSISLAAAILVTDALGVNRGEVVRLWIFFACLVQVPAAAECVRMRSRAAAMMTLATSLLVGTLGVSMMAFGQP